MREEDGERLRALRVRKGVSQEASAAAIGVSRETVLAYENGRSSPSIRDLRALLDFYGETLESFFCVDGDKKVSETDRSVMLKVKWLLSDPDIGTSVRQLIETYYSGRLAVGGDLIAERGRVAEKGRRNRAGPKEKRRKIPA